MVSLLFRLLRQNGHRVSSDVFNKFKDSTTGKFRLSLAGDIHGMLGLYEASYMLVSGKDTLEEALAFSVACLESVDEKRECPSVGKLVRHALKQPIRHGCPRVETYRYIHMRLDDPCDETLLDLAKLDFNLLQKLHQKEACDLVKWAKDLDFTTYMPFARDRTVECYLWALEAYYEPEFSFARRFLAKIVAIITLMDDMFDAYDTLEELELFTQALERWDTTAMDGLPEYMKFYYKALLNIFDEIEEEVALRGHSYRLDYAKQSIKDHAKVYLKEVKWFQQKYIPPIDEYVELASKTVGATMMVKNTLVGMGDVVTEDAFKWLSSNSHILQSYAAACRFSDDIAGYKFEQERGHVASSIHCLVKQYGCTEQEADEILKKKIFDAWKDLNEACLRPLAMPLTVLERVLNWLRSTSVMYDGNTDNFTQVTVKMKEVVADVLVNPFPL